MPGEPRPPFDANWTRSESPLEIALARGARASSDRVWVADAGTIFEVSTVTGEVVAAEKGVLPANGACEQASVSDSVLFVCTQSDGASVFRRPQRASVTKLERTFSSNAPFLLGAGDAVLFAARAMAARRSLACSRSSTATCDPLRHRVGAEGDGAYPRRRQRRGLSGTKTGAKTQLDEPQIAKPSHSSERAAGRTTGATASPWSTA
jgi:hypothetical protein